MKAYSTGKNSSQTANPPHPYIKGGGHDAVNILVNNSIKIVL